MPEPQHFTFGDAQFERIVAHDGEGRISAARVMAGSPGGGAEFIDLVVVPPGCAIGVHTHGADQETYVIIDGSGTMTVDGTAMAVGPGDVVVNRAGGTHGLRNAGAQPLRLVVVDVMVGRGSGENCQTTSPA
jgi:mannose-6-phosphate isomerase-like protein (cupin superfamily)